MTSAVSSSSDAALLPEYRYLSRCIHRRLRSIHDEGRTASAGGNIPDVPPELVDIVADYLWLPQHTLSKELTAKHRLRDAVAHPDIGGVTGGVMCTGQVHLDTVQRDDWTPALRALIMRGWRISAVRYRANMYANGLQVTYRHPSDREQTFSTEMLAGTHHAPLDGLFELEEGERIRQVTVRYNVWLDRVLLETSLGRKCAIGRGEMMRRGRGEDDEWQEDRIKQFRLIPAADAAHCEVLAFHFGVGGHIHNLGVYYQTLRADA